jgi:KaiC/GvpD/RAD55 family RecA-like ATPase
VLSTGCAELDRTIGGGIRVVSFVFDFQFYRLTLTVLVGLEKGITEISGEAGAAKTGLALQMTLQVGVTNAMHSSVLTKCCW